MSSTNPPGDEPSFLPAPSASTHMLPISMELRPDPPTYSEKSPPVRTMSYPYVLICGVSSQTGSPEASQASQDHRAGSTLPALRRDGSSFHINLPHSDQSSSLHAGLVTYTEDGHPSDEPVEVENHCDRMASEDESEAGSGSSVLEQSDDGPGPSSRTSTGEPTSTSRDASGHDGSSTAEDYLWMGHRGLHTGQSTEGAGVSKTPPQESPRKPHITPILIYTLPPPPPYPYSIDEDGRETLPHYSCSIYFEAYLMLKTEFTAPDKPVLHRGWKRVYVILRGTALWVFKDNPRTHPPRDKRTQPVVEVDDLEVGAPHVHLPEDILQQLQTQSSSDSKSSLTPRRRQSEGIGPSAQELRMLRSWAPLSRRWSSNVDDRPVINPPTTAEERTSVPKPPTPPANAHQHHHVSHIGDLRPSNLQDAQHVPVYRLMATFKTNVLIRQYTLAGAETGMALDDLKRQHVVRVRVEGEQFLLHADNLHMAVDWIETFQAGANVALDLDDRPMPRGPIYPRRRRPARRPPEGDDVETRNRRRRENFNLY